MYIFCWPYCFCIVHFGLRLGASALYKSPFKLHCIHTPFILFYVSNRSFATYVAWQEVSAVKHNNCVKHSSPTMPTHPLPIMHKPCTLTYQAQNLYCYISGTNRALTYRAQNLLPYILGRNLVPWAQMLCPYLSGTKCVPLYIRHKTCALTYAAQTLCPWAQKLCPYISGKKHVPSHIRHKTCALT